MDLGQKRRAAPQPNACFVLADINALKKVPRLEKRFDEGGYYGLLPPVKNQTPARGLLEITPRDWTTNTACHQI